MDELRLILMVAGILVIGLIYLFSRRSQQRHEQPDVEEPRVEDTEWMEEIARQRRRLASGRPQPAIDEEPADVPVLDDAVAPASGTDSVGVPSPAPEVEPPLEPGAAGPPSLQERPGGATAGGESTTPKKPEPPPEKATAGQDDTDASTTEELILVLHVTAPDEMLFAGANLFSALEEVGLRFGEGGIFHFYRELEEGEQGPILFSVANILEPGTFEPGEPGEEFATPGVVLFMRAPGPQPARQTIETMLLKSQQLAQLLGGEIRDQAREPLTEDTIRSMLDRASAFDQTAE